VTGVGHELAARLGEEVRCPQVDADHGTGTGKRLRRGLLGSQDDAPAAAFALDADRLDLADHRPVLVHLDVANALKTEAGNGIVASLWP
jgi:hypothetical protein